MKARGFTLIEMLVVISIVAVVSMMAVANLPDFRDKTSLDVISQEIAVDIRGAQVFGSATKYVGSSSDVFPSYGIYFNKAYPRIFFLFADLDPNAGSNNPPANNFLYDEASVVPPAVPLDCGNVSPNKECYQIYSINAPIDIVGIETYGIGNVPTAVGSWLSIVYPKPDTDAKFCSSEMVTCDQASRDNVIFAVITIEAVKNKERRYIIIYNNGQISVSKNHPS